MNILLGLTFLVIVISQLLFLLDPVTPVPKDGSIVITGCNFGGLGLQVAEDIINTQPKTINVICTARKDEDKEKLIKHFNSSSRFQVLLLDVKNVEQIQSLGQSLNSSKVVGLVNNAGISGRSRIENLEYMDIMQVNVFGLLEMTKSLISNLKRNKGSRIVNVGSVAGTFTRPGVLAYGMSKRAVESLTDTLRLELSPNIAVSVVQPGFFASKMCTGPACTGGANEISAAVLHGLFAERPKTRYPCGTLGSMSAWVGMKFVSLLPDRIVDFLIITLDPTKVN